MTEKMPEYLEDKFLEELRRIQLAHRTYWVQSKFIAEALFGFSLNYNEFKRNKTRIYRLGKRLEQKNKLSITKKRDRVGRSTGRSQIIYYHTD